ncbi:MAG: cytochrome B, partial [Bacillota bacterium]
MSEQTLNLRRRLGAALILALVLIAVAGVWRAAGPPPPPPPPPP